MARNKSVKFDIAARDKTGKAFNSVKQKLAGLGKSLGGIKGALAGGFAIAGITAFSDKTLEAADRIAKVADSVGISTDALQEWRKVAGLAGVEQGAFDSGLQSFTKRLGEMKSGTGALTQFLSKYNEELLVGVQNADSTESALALIIEAMAGTEDATQRAALSAAAFGRGVGADLVNIVKGGTEGLDAMRQRVSDLGLVLDEDLLRSSENANDALSLLGDVVLVNLQRVLLQLAPTITKVATFLGTSVPAALEKLSNVNNTTIIVLGVLAAALLAITAPVTAIIAGIAGLTAAWVAWGDDIQRIVGETFAVIEDFFVSRFDAAVASVKEKVDAVIGFFRDMWEQVAGKSFVPDMIDVIEREFARLDEVMVDPTKKALKEVTRSFGDDLSDASAEIIDFVKRGRFEFESFRDFALDALKDLISVVSGSSNPNTGSVGGLVGVGLMKLFGFQHGGSFNVGGQGGADSQVVAFRATPGENVTVTPPGRGGGGGGATILYQIDARGAEIGVEERIRRVLQQATPGIVEAGGNRGLALVSARARSGGPFATAIGAR